MSVDAADFAARTESPEVASERMKLRNARGRLLLGIDRLDYSKGVPRRLLALERLLQLHPEWRGHVRLVQVSVPSRDEVGAYRRFKREVDALVGRINGAHSSPSWTPVSYIYRSIPDTMLLALYGAADVMLVTPVRDGMNLVAKEFVACRTDEDGVLVLSEFAGAADELTDALLVNPYDVDALADALHQALLMPGPERRRRMRALRSQVFANDVHRWTSSFLSALEERRPDVAADARPVGASAR
jgi:trehalose 6-phosphate synthase/phosphatase